MELGNQGGRRKMESVQDYFLCDECDNKDFKPIYNFSVKFHGVNFSDDLIYDMETDELYQCTKCLKTFKKDHIESKLIDFKNLRKGQKIAGDAGP